MLGNLPRQNTNNDAFGAFCEQGLNFGAPSPSKVTNHQNPGSNQTGFIPGRLPLVHRPIPGGQNPKKLTKRRSVILPTKLGMIPLNFPGLKKGKKLDDFFGLDTPPDQNTPDFRDS